MAKIRYLLWNGVLCLIFVFLGLVLIGCVSPLFAPLGSVNCEADSSCMTAAFKNNCSSAYEHTISNMDGNTFTSDTTISKEGGFCVVSFTVRSNGQKMRSTSQSFIFPFSPCEYCLGMASCSDFPSYSVLAGLNTSEGTCVVMPGPGYFP